MKRFVQFHPFSGISGDMTLAALIDAGASLEYVLEGIGSLSLVPNGTTISKSAVVRHAITATKVEVVDRDGKKIDRMMAQDGEDPDHHHGHDHHHHVHDHRHHHAHDHSHEPAGEDHHHHGEDANEGSHHHVTFRSIREEIEGSTLPERVRQRSIAIFRAIAVGEARVHGVDIDEVHFHEVGAVDSIVDIVGVALALEDLGIEDVYSTPVHLGSGGMIRSQHGMIPIPAPATLEILRGYPVEQTSIRSEMTTPTGAGIVAALSVGTGPEGSFRIESTGFGGGTKEFPDRPNLLRVVVGESEESPEGISGETDTVIQLEANIDDMSSEGWPTAISSLLESGALDVWLTQTIMKKGRPGILLSVLVEPGMRGVVEKKILAVTTSIGVRGYEVSRRKLPRRGETFETTWGPVRVKVVVGSSGEEVRPEAEDVERIARKEEISFIEAERRIRDEIATRRESDG